MSSMQSDNGSSQLALGLFLDKAAILPRLIRLKKAPSYLGMNINLFNQVVRPNLKHIPIGDRGIAFDRLELDAWADEYMSEKGYYLPDRSATTRKDVGHYSLPRHPSDHDFNRILDSVCR